MSRARVLGPFLLVLAGAAIAAVTSASSASSAGTCTIYWTGATNTAWNTPTNWSLSDGGPSAGTVPSATDFVCMSTAPTRAAVIATSANRTVAGIRFNATPSVTPSLTLQGGVFTLNTNDSVINNLTATGTITGTSTLTVTGTGSISGAVLTGASKTIGTGATYTSSGTVSVGVTSASTALVVNGSFTLAGTTLQLSTAVSGVSPNAVQVAGTLAMINGASITTAGSNVVKPTFANTGTLTAGGTGRKTIGTAFSNSGAISITSGTLAVFLGPVASAPDTGTIAVASGATLEYGGGTRTVPAGTISGAGTVLVSAGTTTFATGTTLANLTVNGGTVSGSLTVNALTGTSATFTGAGTLTATGSSTVCDVSLGGGYRLLNQGSLAYNANCGYVHVTGGSSWENAGTVTVSGGTAGYYVTADDANPANAFLNDAGATLTLSLTGPAAAFRTTVPFSNAGTVNVTVGKFLLNAGTAVGASDTGTYTVASGTTLTFGAGGRSIGAATLSGTGTISVTGGTVTFAAGVTLPNLTLNGGTIAGSPSIGTFTGTTGTVSGPGTTTLTGTSTLCQIALASGARLVNQGSASYNSDCGYLEFAAGSVFENSSTLAVSGGTQGYYLYDDDGNAGNAFVNDAGATVNVGLANASAVVRSAVAFSNAGTVNLTVGRLPLNAGSAAGTPDSGTYTISSGTVLTFGGGARTVSAATLSGAGSFVIAGGTVTFTSRVTVSNLTQTGGTIAGSPTIGAYTGTSGTFDGPGTATLTGTSSLCSVSLQDGYRLLDQGTATYDTNCGYLEFGGSSTLENAGTFTVTGGTAGYYCYDDDNSANAIVNDVGATFTTTATNAGALIRSAVAFSNAGTVNVTVGKLTLNAGSVPGSPDTGTYTVASGARLIFGGGQRTVGAATLNGAGTFEVAGGTVAFSNGVSVPNLTVSGGTISGSPSIGVLTANGGTFTGNGTATLTGAGSVIVSTELTSGYRLLNQGALTYQATNDYFYVDTNATLENAGSLTVAGVSGYGFYDNSSTGVVVNDAGATVTVNLGANANVATVFTSFTNNGTLTATRGALRLSTLTNLSNAGVLTGGTWTANGGVIGFPRSIVTNAATTTLGATGGLNQGQSTTSALVALASNSGTLSIGQSVNGTASFSNTGTVAVTGGTWRVLTFTQTAGSTTVASGAVLKSGTSGTAAVAINGGVLSGTGTVQGAVAGVGTVQPGTAGAGTLAVTGTWNAAPATTLAVTAGATSTSLAVSGAAAVAGTLAVTTVQPTPAVGTTVTVVSAGSVTGTFATVTGLDVPASNADWTVGYSPTSVTLTLTAYPQVSVAGGSVVEGASGTATLPFTVSLSAASSQTVTVAYATSDGTATAGTDYTAVSNTLTFAPGTTTQTVNVAVTGDTLFEADETVTLTLSAPASAVLGTASATGTIINDDAPPAVSVGTASGTVGAGSGATLVFPVTLSAPSGLDATVSYATADGSAVAPADYTATSGTLTIPAGSTSGTITVSAPAQAGYAPPKTFTVTLANPVNASLGTAAATGTITNSNPSGGTPSVASVAPSSSGQATSVSVVINGQNLPSNATVTVSGTGVNVSNVVVSTTSRITATFSVIATAAPGSRDVTVNGTGGPATCTACFTVTARPTSGTLSRTAFAAGNIDAQLDVTGVGYQPGTTLRLVKGARVIDATSVSVDSSTALTAYLTVATNALVGPYNVVLTNPDGGTTTCANCVTVFAAPKVTSVSPSTVAVGTSTAMTFTGTGFVAGARISVQGATLSTVVFVNATTMTATVTFPANAAIGSKTVKVFNPASAGSGVGTTAAAISVTG